MKNQFAQLDDHGAVFVRRDKVVMVEGIGDGKVEVALEGSGSARLIHTSVAAVFDKLETSQKRYVQEEMIVEFACDLWRARNEPQYDRVSAIETAERNFDSAVRKYLEPKR